jgi:streptogramin lyase
VDSNVDGVAVRTLTGRPIAAPIDVAVAFGSVWVAAHHGGVIRVDPASMTIRAVIPVTGGPGWFAVAEDAVWVSNQMGQGMTRIDPETNEVRQAGRWATCGRPLVARGVVWQPACDAHRIMRIDPATAAAADIAAPAQTSIVAVGDDLITSGPNGLARFDEATTTFSQLGGGDAGWAMAFDGRTIWASDDRQVVRLDPADGHVVARIAITECGAVAFRKGHAWLTSATGLVEVDPKTNRIIRTVPLGRTAAITNDDSGLWVTSYDANRLLRVRP